MRVRGELIHETWSVKRFAITLLVMVMPRVHVVLRRVSRRCEHCVSLGIGDATGVGEGHGVYQTTENRGRDQGYQRCESFEA